MAAALLALLGLLFIHAMPARAEGSAYLPLELGKKWVLHSRDWNLDISFEVVAIEQGAFRVKIHNPWLGWESLLFPVKDKVYLQSLVFGTQEFPMGGYTLHHDFGAPAGSDVAVATGNLRVLSRTRSVATDRRTYTDCTKIELVGSGGFRQAWTFAAGVGFVEFEFAGITFTLDESASILNVPPGVGQPPWQAPAPKSDRILAVDVNTSSGNDYLSALAKGQAIGMQASSLHFDWNTLEPAPESYQGADLALANSFYPARGIGMNLTIAPIHNALEKLPDDLKGLPLDHPSVVSRFRKLLDFVLATTAQLDLKTLVIGSEIDVYLGADPERWSQFTNFYRQAAAHARTVRPGVKIATEHTFTHGFLGAPRPFVQAINQYSDVIAVSYYPLDLEGMVLDPSVIPTHFRSIAEAFPLQAVHFTQIGYPSSTQLRSSAALQASFARETFKARDLHADRVKLVKFAFLHDFDPQAVAHYCDYFGLRGGPFEAFLGSLGLRTFAGDGTDKTAFGTLSTERALRGW